MCSSDLHPITDGLDLSLIPSGARGGKFYRYEPQGDVAVEAAGLPVVATRLYGKGRVVAPPAPPLMKEAA